MKEDLVIRLNTKASIAVAECPEMVGLYTRMRAEEGERYKKATFAKVINYCIEQGEESTLEEDKTLAGEIRVMLSENSPEKPFEITAYDENRTPKRNATNSRSMIIHLDDYVEKYIDKRSKDGGEPYEYLDMVVDLNTKVGK